MTHNLTLEMIIEHISKLRKYRTISMKKMQDQKNWNVSDIIEEGVRLTNKITSDELDDFYDSDASADIDIIKELKDEISITYNFVKKIKGD